MLSLSSLIVCSRYGNEKFLGGVKYESYLFIVENFRGYIKRAVSHRCNANFSGEFLEGVSGIYFRREQTRHPPSYCLCLVYSTPLYVYLVRKFKINGSRMPTHIQYLKRNLILSGSHSFAIVLIGT